MSTAARGLGRSARAFATFSHARLTSRAAGFSAFPGQSMYVRQMASVSAAVNSRATSMLAALAGAGTLATAIATLQTAECDASAAVPAVALGSGLPDGLKPVEKLSDFDVVLYQYQPCPFCNKVRAFLDYHKVSTYSDDRCCEAPRKGWGQR
jgi:microsomal prostaglandin-E synthase 2